MRFLIPLLVMVVLGAPEVAAAQAQMLVSAAVPSSGVRSAALRRARPEVEPIRRSLDTVFGKRELSWAVSVHRSGDPAASIEDRIGALLLRDSELEPEEATYLLDVKIDTVDTVGAVALADVTRCFGEEAQSAGLDARVRRLHRELQALLSRSPELSFHRARWTIADAQGAEATGWVLADRNTGEMLWVRRLEIWD